jgi:hypothetical protein
MNDKDQSGPEAANEPKVTAVPAPEVKSNADCIRGLMAMAGDAHQSDRLDDSGVDTCVEAFLACTDLIRDVKGCADGRLKVTGKRHIVNLAMWVFAEASGEWVFSSTAEVTEEMASCSGKELAAMVPEPVINYVAHIFESSAAVYAGRDDEMLAHMVEIRSAGINMGELEMVSPDRMIQEGLMDLASLFSERGSSMELVETFARILSIFDISLQTVYWLCVGEKEGMDEIPPVPALASAAAQKAVAQVITMKPRSNFTVVPKVPLVPEGV